MAEREPLNPDYYNMGGGGDIETPTMFDNWDNNATRDGEFRDHIPLCFGLMGNVYNNLYVTEEKVAISKKVRVCESAV